MALSCASLNYTSYRYEYPPGFDPAIIQGYLKDTKECFWFDGALESSQLTLKSIQPDYSAWNALMPKIWRNVIPEGTYNSSLVHCYDIAVLAGHSARGYGPHIYAATATQCCRKSTFATGDPDLGGIGVSI